MKEQSVQVHVEKPTTNIVVEEGYTINKNTVYLGVNEFLWTVVIMTGLFGAILKIMWGVLREQIKDSSTSDEAIYAKIDEEAERFKKGINRIDDRFEADRTEFKKDLQRIDDRVWDIKE